MQTKMELKRYTLEYIHDGIVVTATVAAASMLDAINQVPQGDELRAAWKEGKKA